MGFFRRKRKVKDDNAADVVPNIKEVSPIVNWKRLPEGPGDIVGMLKAEWGKAHEANMKPVLLVSSSFDTGSKKIREFRPQMDAVYKGIHIVEVYMNEWDIEHLRRIKFKGTFPCFSEIGEDGMPTGNTMTGAVWGEDTLENMLGSIRDFLQGL